MLRKTIHNLSRLLVYGKRSTFDYFGGVIDECCSQFSASEASWYFSGFTEQVAFYSNKVFDTVIPSTPKIEAFFTNTMIFKVVGLAVLSYLFTMTSGLTSLFALSVNAIALVGAVYLASQLLRSHIQAAAESCNLPEESGFVRTCFEAIKALVFSAWFTAYENAQLVIKDDAPYDMSFMQYFKYLTMAGGNEANNWTDPIRFATPIVGLGLIALSSIAGVSLNFFSVGAMVVTAVFYDFLLPSTRVKQTSGFLVPAALDTLDELKTLIYEGKKDPISLMSPGPVFDLAITSKHFKTGNGANVLPREQAELYESFTELSSSCLF